MTAFGTTLNNLPLRVATAAVSLSLISSAGATSVNCPEPNVLRAAMPRDSLTCRVTEGGEGDVLLLVNCVFDQQVGDQPFASLWVTIGGPNGFSFSLSTNRNDHGVNGKGGLQFSFLAPSIDDLAFEFRYQLPRLCPADIEIYTSGVETSERLDTLN